MDSLPAPTFIPLMPLGVGRSEDCGPLRQDTGRVGAEMRTHQQTVPRLWGPDGLDALTPCWLGRTELPGAVRQHVSRAPQTLISWTQPLKTALM